MHKTIILAGLAALALGGAAQAQSPINARQLNQERRIDAGVRSGKLTHREAARLKAEQRRIAYHKRALKARQGGHLTGYQKDAIHAQQARANAHILNQKHDAQRGPNKMKL